ncbi:MAG: GDP-mannose 4,6-dehydratase [Verrucomicrobia bacterium]|nr:MAG: GDP-mannose 4,6-dehydratase [Verrucomicrobiota bacterium]
MAIIRLNHPNIKCYKAITQQKTCCSVMTRHLQMKSCAIIGCDGQDGKLLSEQLQAEGHHVVGIRRNTLNISDRNEVITFLSELNPQEVYYLAAFHHSSEDEIKIDDAELFNKSFAVHLHGLVHFLEGIKQSAPACRLLYAASSHVFGEPALSPQNENTPLQPRNVYAISKVAGMEACRYYRKNHGVYAASAILYNHESPYRKAKFVSQKIICGALSIKQGKQEELVLGNLDAAIDWGYAPDYVDAMRRCIRLKQADDFIVATGETHTVREFVEIVFDEVGLDWKKHVRTNPQLLTKSTMPLKGDATKLRLATGWRPTMDFVTMVKSLLHAQSGSLVFNSWISIFLSPVMELF